MAHVQAAKSGGNASTSQAPAFTGVSTVGNYVLVSIVAKNTGTQPVISSVTDNATPPNTYAPAGAWSAGIASGGNTYWSILYWAKLANVPALLTVTGTVSVSQVSLNVDIDEYSGVAAVDLTSYISGGSVSGAAVSLTPVLSQPNEMLHCGVFPQNSCVATAPWTRAQSGFLNCCTFYNQLGGVSGSQPQNVGTLTAGYWVGSMVGLIPAMSTTIVPVQSKTFTSAPGAAVTQTISFNAPSAVGNLLTLKTNNTGGGVVGTPTDDKGGQWLKAGSITTGSWTVDLWYCLSSKAATTITYGTAATGGPGAVLDEWNAGAGYTWSLDGTPKTNNSLSNTTSLTVGPLTIAGTNDLLISIIMQNSGGSITPGPGYTPVNNSGWLSAFSVSQYQLAALPGAYNASATFAAATSEGVFAAFLATPPSGGGLPPGSSISYGQYMRQLARQNQILGGPGARTSDNEFTIMARNNKLLGGPMATPADTILSMMSKQNKLLGGTGARTNENQYWVYVRILKQLGGTAYPSDNVNTLLRKINTLI